MITPSFSLTATERVLPKLALDFTTATLDSRITFTRALNTATRVNSSGYVEVVNADLPRFDYSPTSLTCKGLLIEESRINLFTQSEAFNDVSWVKSNATIGQDVAVSPSNVQNADKIIEAATNSTHFIEKVVALVSGTSYTWTGFFKAAGRSVVLFQVFTNVNHFGYFDVNAGTVGATGNATSTISNMGNGWYRCSVTFTSGATGNGFFDTYLSNGSSTSYTGDGTSGIYIWGAQLEAGAFPTSYIPTTTTALTRNADVATMTGTNFSSWYVAGGGSLTVQAAMVGGVPSSSQRIVSLSGSNPNTDDISIYWDTSFNYPLGSVRAANSQQYSGGAAVTIGSQQTFNSAFRWATNIGQEANNGSIATVDNSVTLPTVVSMGFGQPAVSQGTANVWIKKVAYYPQTLTANETKAFSKG